MVCVCVVVRAGRGCCYERVIRGLLSQGFGCLFGTGVGDGGHCHRLAVSECGERNRSGGGGVCVVEQITADQSLFGFG